MKKLILLLGLTTLLFSCSSNDDSNNNQTENIVGSWKIISIIDIDDNSKTAEPCDLETLFIIKADNTYSNQNFDPAEDPNTDGTVTCTKGDFSTGTYETEADTLTIKSTGGTNELTYKFENGNLVITTSDVIATYKRS